MIEDLPEAGNNPVASSSRARTCHESHDITLSDEISLRYILELLNLTDPILCLQLSDMEDTTGNKDREVTVWRKHCRSPHFLSARLKLCEKALA